jgi:beta-glucanase (GH16 family)
VNVTLESDELDVFFPNDGYAGGNGSNTDGDVKLDNNTKIAKEEPFVYMMSAPTLEGPRKSIRLEGNRRFNRGLFIVDVRHMPTGCGSWPAFWLTDEGKG